MQPTFENGDRLIAVRHFTPKRNDIVILKAPDQKGALYIKRVVGMPGDMVTSKMISFISMVSGHLSLI